MIIKRNLNNMTSKLPTYPEYKASGIDWLGDIPSHWNTVKGAWCCTFQYGFPADSRFFSNERKGIPLIRIRDIYSHDTEIYYNNSDFTPEYIVNNGDILIGMDGDFNVSRWKGGVSLLNQRVCKFEKSDSLIKGFLFYVLPIILKEINNIKYSTTVKHLSAHDLSEMRLPVPPHSEQRAIAAYLDDVTGKVDALIAEKQKQVEDIRAYRTSIITETVTHGLNPDTPLRPSGIDWLGDVPEHWKIINLKYLINEPLMYGANESPEIETNLSDPRYIRITDIDENGCLKKETFRTLQLEKAQPYVLKYGDILFARSGATVGKTYQFTEDYPAAFAGYLIKASCGPKIDSLFLLYYTNTQCYNNWKNSIFDKSTIQNIAADKYNNLPVVVPPLAEQQAIADFLEVKTAKINELISELTKQIDELAEYKQAVITEAVTGKVDVRDYKPSN